LTAQEVHLLHRNWLVVVEKEARKRGKLGKEKNVVFVVGETAEEVVHEKVQENIIAPRHVEETCLLPRNELGKFTKMVGKEVV
jgi:hypothetical protein